MGLSRGCLEGPASFTLVPPAPCADPTACLCSHSTPPPSSSACPTPAPSQNPLCSQVGWALPAAPRPPASPIGFGPSTGQAVGTSAHRASAIADDGGGSAGTGLDEGLAGAVAVLRDQEEVPAYKHSPHGHQAGSSSKTLIAHVSPALPGPPNQRGNRACLCAGAAVGCEARCLGGHSYPVTWGAASDINEVKTSCDL